MIVVDLSLVLMHPNSWPLSKRNGWIRTTWGDTVAIPSQALMEVPESESTFTEILGNPHIY